MKNEQKGYRAVIKALEAQGWTEQEAIQAFRDGIAEGLTGTRMASDLASGNGPDRETADSHMKEGKASEGK